MFIKFLKVFNLFFLRDTPAARLCPPPPSVMPNWTLFWIRSPILNSNVDRAEPFIRLFEFVKIIHGLFKYSLNLEAIIPIRPSWRFSL